MAKIKEKGLLHLAGANTMTKKVKKQQNKKPIDKLGGVLPDEGTGIDVITGTTYSKPTKKKKK